MSDDNGTAEQDTTDDSTADEKRGDHTGGPDARPVLRVVGGSPTPEELAVLTALVSASGGDGAADDDPRVRRGGWNDPSAMHQRTLTPGPNAWRSALR